MGWILGFRFLFTGSPERGDKSSNGNKGVSAVAVGKIEGGGSGVLQLLLILLRLLRLSLLLLLLLLLRRRRRSVPKALLWLV